MDINFKYLPNDGDDKDDFKGSFDSDISFLRYWVKPFPMEIGKYKYWESNNFDLETLKIIKLLECDPEFEKRIKKIRKEFKIPSEGFTPEEKLKVYADDKKLQESLDQKKEKEDFIKRINVRCLEIFEDFNIPYSIKKSLGTVVVSNYLDEASEFRLDFKQESWNKGHVKITIDVFAPLTTSYKIKKELDRNWDNIFKLLTSYSKANVKLPNIENVAMWQLKKKMDLSYKEIADIINEKYELDLDESEVRKRVSNMKKKYLQINPKYME